MHMLQDFDKLEESTKNNRLDVNSCDNGSFKLPIIKNQFRLKQWLLLSKVKEDILASQLVNIKISLSRPEYKMSPHSHNTVVFEFEDDSEGLISNIITQDFSRSINVPLIRIGLGSDDKYGFLNLEGVAIINIKFITSTGVSGKDCVVIKLLKYHGIR